MYLSQRVTLETNRLFVGKGPVYHAVNEVGTV
jgi:hypothetical protein